MIYLSVVLLLDGICANVDVRRPSKDGMYLFAGIGSSFQFIIKKVGTLVEISSRGERIDFVPIPESIWSIWQGADHFAKEYSQFLKKGDPVFDVWNIAIHTFRKSFGIL